ncbi:hypothetical protein CEXT_521931 [Caerostris extrusa]|uniref:Uncharacterized protein n=1 Tax=Caerostris extrusa TaxID=172846 RepID=A0AAV4SQ94_CAEEX|nr:hypothetical protein CEXT_521931 [Caerostris extrusa]
MRGRQEQWTMAHSSKRKIPPSKTMRRGIQFAAPPRKESTRKTKGPTKRAGSRRLIPAPLMKRPGAQSN